MRLRTPLGFGAATAVVILGLLVAACGSPSSTPSATPATPGPAASDPQITLTGPSAATAGSTFSVSWTGAETSGDFLVIVPAGATEWVETADSPYVNATVGNPAQLTAPKAPGAYEIWFMKGDTEGVQTVKARLSLSVT